MNLTLPAFVASAVFGLISLYLRLPAFHLPTIH